MSKVKCYSIGIVPQQVFRNSLVPEIFLSFVIVKKKLQGPDPLIPYIWGTQNLYQNHGSGTLEKEPMFMKVVPETWQLTDRLPRYVVRKGLISI